MASAQFDDLTEQDFKTPLLVSLCRLVRTLTGISPLVVFPQRRGWAQVWPAGDVELPSYCKIIHSTKDGKKRCSMCHVLLAAAGCGRGAVDERCHAGVSVLVTPVPGIRHDPVAVLSTCVFTPKVKAEAWQEARKKGAKLGVDLKKLKQAYDHLPDLRPEPLAQAHSLLDMVARAVGDVIARHTLEKELAEYRKGHSSKSKVATLVEDALKNVPRPSQAGELPAAEAPSRKKLPALIAVTTQLISATPNLPYSVSEIAEAARMTPNSFSVLFHQHMSTRFSEYLAEKRMELAKTLLGDLTLCIKEVALRSGYDDPAYFARRFRQITGMTPREWRDALRSTPAKG